MLVSSLLEYVCRIWWVHIYVSSSTHTWYCIVGSGVDVAFWLQTMAGQQPFKNATLETSTNVEKVTLAQNGSSVLWHVLLSAVLIVLILVVAIIVSKSFDRIAVRWIYLQWSRILGKMDLQKEEVQSSSSLFDTYIHVRSEWRRNMGYGHWYSGKCFFLQFQSSSKKLVHH